MRNRSLVRLQVSIGLSVNRKQDNRRLPAGELHGPVDIFQCGIIPGLGTSLRVM